jgi:hypothetical protein
VRLTPASRTDTEAPCTSVSDSLSGLAGARCCSSIVGANILPISSVEEIVCFIPRSDDVDVVVMTERPEPKSVTAYSSVPIVWSSRWIENVPRSTTRGLLSDRNVVPTLSNTHSRPTGTKLFRMDSGPFEADSLINSSILAENAGCKLCWHDHGDGDAGYSDRSGGDA